MTHIVSRKKNTARHNKTVLVSMLSLAALPAMATAAETDVLPTIQVTAEGSSGNDSYKVDNVQSSKFTAPLLDTPKSVVVIPKKVLEDTQATTLSDALRTVPGITLGAGEGGNPNGDRPFIRGFTSESSIYVDGVRNATSQNREMFAVEQVDVIKGSSSTIGGGGSTGGSINLVTKVAHQGDALEGTVSGGTDNYARITLDGNKDFGNGVAGRVAVLGHQNEKAGQTDGAEYKRAGIAPSIALGLGTENRAVLSYYYLKTDDMPDSGVPYWDAATNTATGKPLQAKQGIYYGWKDRDFQQQENQIGTLKLEHDFNDELTLANTAVWSNSKNDYAWTQPDDSKGNIVNGQVWRRANSRITDTDTFNDQLALTGKFNTGMLKHSFNAGAEYSKQESERGSYTAASNSGKPILGADDTKTPVNDNACALGTGAASNGWCTDLNNPNPQDVWKDRLIANKRVLHIDTETTGIYLLDNIELNPQWLVDLGVRWDQFNTDMLTYASGVKFSNDSDFFNYQAGLTYKPASNSSIYASYATSANPVGVDAGDGSENISAANQNLKPEEIRTMEIGTKWDFLDQKLNATAAIFRTEKTNTRATDVNGNSQNIGETRVDGIELGLSGNITEQWAIFAGYSYLDSELVDGGAINLGTTAAPNYVAGAYNGNTVPNVAKNSGSLWTTYKILPQLTLGAGVFGMDKVYGNTANTKYVPGYARYDAMAQYIVNKNVNLQLNVNNLSDKRYFTKAYASHYATEADGRNAILSLNFKY
ncbi:TonB-dependent receptor [Alkanindiges illinoisensis]|uniref:TonB-dependent receptor n=1 Tax=Alkanindiges illinoisensis TaxID=197183 RepID=UPI00047E81EA|nr:TonB-dependent receptor [Alkanindiges illinoisensis]